jgi:hypothetical protein
MNRARIIERLRDWWRGYSQEDVRSLMEKLHTPSKSGALIPLTKREHAALCAGFGIAEPYSR